MTALTPLTAYTGTVPVKASQTPTDFATNVGYYLDYFDSSFTPETNGWVAEVNTLSAEMEISAGEASDSATQAANSAAIAQAATAYKGDWVAAYNTTGYDLGMSVSYTDGFNYISKVDDNLVEPTTLTNTTEWDYLESVSPTLLALKADKTEVLLLTNVTTYVPTTDYHPSTKKYTDDADDLKQPILASSYTQIADATVLDTATHTFNFANGDLQQLTAPASGSITIAFSGFIANRICTMIVDLVNFGGVTVNHPSGMIFDGGNSPIYSESGIDRFNIIKDADNIYSMFLVGSDIKVVT